MRILSILGLAWLLAFPAAAQTLSEPYPNFIKSNADIVHAGEHVPMVWTGSDSISGTAMGAYTTDWIQIGASRNTTAANNSVSFKYNPEVFTLSVMVTEAMYVAANADTAYIVSARFEVADSSTATVPFWNADSSNLFIASGNYNRADYGVWTYEPGPIPEILTRRQTYRLRVLQGDYIRLIFAATAIADTSLVAWTLKGEN